MCRLYLRLSVDSRIQQKYWPYWLCRQPAPMPPISMQQTIQPCPNILCPLDLTDPISCYTKRERKERTQSNYSESSLHWNSSTSTVCVYSWCCCYGRRRRFSHDIDFSMELCSICTRLKLHRTRNNSGKKNPKPKSIFITYSAQNNIA